VALSCERLGLTAEVYHENRERLRASIGLRRKLVSCNDGMDSPRNVLGIFVPTLP
jgi:hypothetical protein